MFGLLLFCHLNFAYAQVPTPAAVKTTVELRGRVLEMGTRKPLSQVNIFVLPQKLKAVTDEQGYFKVDGVNQGPTELVINITGYNKFQEKLDLDESEEGLQLFVEKTSYKYFETTVTDLRNKRDESQKRLSQEEFLQMPGSGGDPVKAVQNLPGVSRSSGGDARVVIQGSEPENTRYNIEGHDVPLVFHFGGLSSIVMPEAVSSVDYYSAGYGPEFGNALGGHVGLNVRKPKTDRFHAMAFMDIFNVGGLVEGPISKDSSYLVSGRYSYVGAALKKAAKDNKDFNLTVAPVFYDLNAQYNRKLNDQDDFRLFTILSRDQLEFVLNKPVGNDPKLRGGFEQVTEFYRIIPEWTRQVDADTKVAASLGLGGSKYLVDFGNNFYDQKSQTVTARGDYEKKLDPLWKANWGLDSSYTNYDVNVRIPSTFSSGGISNPISTGDLRETHITGNQNVLGLYWRNEVKPANESPWVLLPSARMDRYSSTKEALVQPRVTVKYAWDPSLHLKASTGLYVQQPSGQAIDATYGNPDIKSERAEHYYLGFEKDSRGGATDGFTWLGGVFYKKLDNLIVNSSQLVQRNGAMTPENYNNNGIGHIHGFELQSKYKIDQWGFTGSYTYLQSRRQRPNEAELPSPYDQTHSLNLLVGYERGPWQYGTRVRYVTGNPYTPVVGGYYDADNDVYLPQRGEIYGERESAFFQVDLRIDRKWVYDNCILSAYLDVQNVTNQRNQEGLTYSYDYTEKQEVTGLPVLPTIGFRGEF